MEPLIKAKDPAALEGAASGSRIQTVLLGTLARLKAEALALEWWPG